MPSDSQDIASVFQSLNHTQWMSECLTLAQSAVPIDVPVGALLLDLSSTKQTPHSSPTLLASGFNTRERDHNPTGHAEMTTLQTAAKQLKNWRLSQTALYVTLEPCPMCASAIIQSRIPYVVFGAYDPIAGACGSAYNLFDKPSAPHVMGGILESECTQALRRFFESRRSDAPCPHQTND